MEVSCDDFKETKNDSEDSDLFREPPRLFRHSLIYQTLSFIYPSKRPRKNYRRSFKENVWWFVIMLIGFSIAFSIIDQAWQRFQINPTFTSIILNNDGMKIAYPTIDICPNNFVDYKKVQDFSDYDFETFSEGSGELEIVDLIPNFKNLTVKSLKKLTKALKTDDLRILTFKIAVKCIEFILNCNFKGKNIDCCTKFLPILTENGLCFSFNAKVYGTSISELKNPEIMTMTEFENHQLTFDLSQSAKLFIHSRDEFLNHQTRHAAQIEEKHSVNVLFSMRQTYTDDNARDLRLHQRNCFFSNENPSKFYANKAYSYASCLRDCRIEQVQKSCGCLSPFYRPNNVENITYCSIDDFLCLKNEKMLANDKDCVECHLPCDFVAVSVEKISDRLNNNNATVSSSVKIDLHQWPYISFHREVRFGLMDFLVAFGSIFALFLGFSFLSFIEILICILKYLFTSPDTKKESKKETEDFNIVA